MRNDAVVVGVDAGGSSVNVAIDDDVLAFATPANPTAGGVERSADAIAGAIDAALRGRTPDAIAVGAAGAGLGEVAARLQLAIERRFPTARVSVVDDARIALRGTIPHGDGIVLVAGTGSIAYGEIGGRTFRAGGYGYAFGDDGSGYAIGSAALRLLVRSFEGRAPLDAMLQAIAAQLQAGDAAEVVRRIYGDAPVAAVAGLARIVVDFADRSERSAVKIVQSAAQELFDLVRAVWRAAGAGDRELPVAFCGGLVRENNMLTFLLQTRIANDLPLARIERGGTPAAGALTIARESLKS